VVCNFGCDVGLIVCEGVLFGGTEFSVWCAIMVVMWDLLCLKVCSFLAECVYCVVCNIGCDVGLIVCEGVLFGWTEFSV
jgi:hypothetical protein